MKILAIETSCDETAIALVEASGGPKNPRFKVLKNLIASQVETHRPWGGVVPNLAKREHLNNLPILFETLNTRYSILDTDLIAVTVGPGLEPCLWAGITFAEELAKKYKKSLIGVNHLEGHLYSFLLPQKAVNSKFSAKGGSASGGQIPNSKLFPAISLLVSGGHTILLLMKDLTHWKKLGETRDDAVGEAFDKVAKMLGLPYPGGPELEKLAGYGRPTSINFPRPMIHTRDYDFSFSGLKTSVLYFLKDKKDEMDERMKRDVAASFQQAAIDALVHKTIRAAKKYRVKSVMLSGGVAANKELRKALQSAGRKSQLKFVVPDFKYNTDNAAMIAAAAYIKHLQNKKTAKKLTAKGNLTI